MELKTLELGFEDVDGVWTDVMVERVEDACEVLGEVVVVENGALELVDGDGDAELDVLLAAIIVVVWKLDNEGALVEYEVVTW